MDFNGFLVWGKRSHRNQENVEKIENIYSNLL